MEVAMDQTGVPADLRSLIERELPDGRANLENSYANLERVAAYCEANYMQATDKRAAFEETKRYTVQSLASVAYQINTLASSLLTALDLQTEKIAGMESQVNNISQIVDIHKEKVARREIGLLTANKSVQRQHKIISPAHQERPQRYQRTPIDYSVLDDLGHGVKLTVQQPAYQQQQQQQQLRNQQQQQLLGRTSSTVSGGSSASSGGAGGGPTSAHHQAYFPGYEHLLPKGMQSTIAGGGSMSSRGEQHYRTPVVQMQDGRYSAQTDVAYTSGMPGASGVPQLQQHTSLPTAMLGYNQQHQTGNYSAVSVAADMARQQQLQPSHYQQQQQSMPLPPPQLAPVDQYRLSTSSNDGLPPPPDDFIYMDDHRSSSPPLPPPPVVATDPASHVNIRQSSASNSSSHQIPEMPQYGVYLGRQSQINLPDWVPNTYLEKAVALYDYDAQKPDELTFQESAVIYVLKKNDDGWYEGVSDGVTGLFPGNYVESCM